MAIQDAVNKAITTGASFLLASQELKNRRAKEQKVQMQKAEAEADLRMKKALAQRKQEAEAVKARSEEFRKLVMEGTPQYGNGPKEVIRYGK